MASRNEADKLSEHLSVSQANRCLARLAFERFAGIKDKPSTAQAFGSYFHALAECAFLNKGEPEIPAGLTRGALAQVEKLFATYWRRIGCAISRVPTEAERRFEFRGWTRRPIIGYIDLLYDVGLGRRVVDLKTKRRPVEAIADYEVRQLATYRAALGLGPGPAELHVALTDGSNEVYTLESDVSGKRVVTEEQIEEARARFVALEAAYDSRIFPAEPNPYCKLCPAYPHCAAGTRFDGRIDEWMARHGVAHDAKGERTMVATSTKDTNAQEPKPAATVEPTAPAPTGLAPKALDIMDELEDSKNIRPYLKVALVGEYGTLKTRTALAFPAPVVADTERGAELYAGEFSFKRLPLKGETREYLNKVYALVKRLAADPGDRRTFVMDSWSVYCERVENVFSDIYLQKEKTSAGNKGDYYLLQPRDYKPFRRKLMNLIIGMIGLNMHTIVTMQEKDKWDDLKVIGKTFDGNPRTPYFFDTVIFLRKVTDPKTGEQRVVGILDKDRTGKLPARIDPFSFAEISKYWGEFLSHESRPAADVFEEQALAATLPTVVLPEPKPAATGSQATPPERPAVAPAPPEATSEEPSTAPAAAPETPEDSALAVEEPLPNPLKADYLEALEAIRTELGIPDEAWQAILTRRGVKAAHRLKVAEVVDILGKLEQKLSAQHLAEWHVRYPFRATGAEASA